jgi:type III restriction enzyme
MNQLVNAIAGRLSLRTPQRRSLEILARVLDIAAPAKGADVAGARGVITSEFATLQDFEREFVSLCFALATGVGKTRLMGAFIAYLYLTGKSRHFFVLAPNLTIYNKLIADFTPGTPKYVFQGLAEFATTPPVVVTGENYEDGMGIRADLAAGFLPMGSGFDTVAMINVFNIAKINSDVRGSTRGGRPPRIKRLAEYIGESYFDYLAALPDLVLLMDESHRYRADAGTKAINDLRPILGLELTATPFTESPRGPVPFKNVVYSYSLAEAITDGFVKEPAVATRKDFDASALQEEQLERIKLEDGIRLHEQVKADLRIYADQSGRQPVKPFMLVIAKDTEHAGKLVAQFKSPTFFGGQYAEKVIEVHSALRGEEQEETVKRLLAVERADEPTEVVVHVNMLKEGWDVTNLYTIVPLRAANARTLIEQSIGRGLRLPYGKRVGVPAVDRLTIVAHDKFREIVEEANRGDSIIRKIEQIVLGPDGAPEPPKVVAATPVINQVLSGVAATVQGGVDDAPGTCKPLFTTDRAQAIARATLAVIQNQERMRSSADLLKPEVQQRIVADVKALMPVQPDLPYPEAEAAASIVAEATAAFIAHSIDIPKISLVPKGDVTVVFTAFDLDVAAIRFQPVAEDILIQHLQSHHQEHLAAVGTLVEEERLEDYVIRALIEFDDIDYDTNADLLYRLAGQAVAQLRSYLPDDGAVKNVLLCHQPRLAHLIHGQMEQHRVERVDGYEVKVMQGFRKLANMSVKLEAGQKPRHFRDTVDDKRNIPRMVFDGFAKCLYSWQKFSSDPERRFAVILEKPNDGTVLKWVKPGPGSFQITYRGGEQYEPDFVVETADSRLMVEIKADNEMDAPDVLAKARAAVVWCRHASEHTRTTDGKRWRYLLIPDRAVVDNMSLDGLARECELENPDIV